MGKVLSRVSRPVKNLYIDQRTDRLIDKIETGRTHIKPPSATADARRLQQAQTDDTLKNVDERSEELLKNMHEIVIRSSDVKTVGERIDRKYTREQMKGDGRVPEYRFYEPAPEKIPAGKMTFREALELMSAHAKLKHAPGDAAAVRKLNMAEIPRVTLLAAEKAAAEDDIRQLNEQWRAPLDPDFEVLKTMSPAQRIARIESAEFDKRAHSRYEEREKEKERLKVSQIQEVNKRLEMIAAQQDRARALPQQMDEAREHEKTRRSSIGADGK